MGDATVLASARARKADRPEHDLEQDAAVRQAVPMRLRAICEIWISSVPP